MTTALPPDSQMRGFAALLPAKLRPYALLARFDRSAAFAVLDRADLDGDGLWIDVNDVRVPLVGVDAGAVPPYRRDASQDAVPPSR